MNINDLLKRLDPAAFKDVLKPGTVTMMEFGHDEGCPTLKSQSMNDCTCKETEVRLRRVK